MMYYLKKKKSPLKLVRGHLCREENSLIRNIDEAASYIQKRELRVQSPWEYLQEPSELRRCQLRQYT